MKFTHGLASLMKSPLAPIQAERPREALPTRRAAIFFRFKAFCFQARRAIVDGSRAKIVRHPRAEDLTSAPLRSERSSDLWFETNAKAEQRLQLGKVQNLRTAAALFHGTEIPAGATWSFWRQLGRTTARRGFAVGRELREGCLIPTLGGGLCQLSGAIYNAAVEAGIEVVERHRHSHPGVGTLATLGRDATVFWNYVDLRLRAPFAWRLEVRLTATRLIVRVRSLETATRTEKSPERNSGVTIAAEPGSCASCGVNDCFRHLQPEDEAPARTAWLVDEWWPEWKTHLTRLTSRPALLLRPLDGRRWRRANYAWNAAAFVKTQSATVLTLRRAWATRRLREQGAERQRALLAWDEKLARSYTRRLRAEHTHLVVAQNLLPFLWRDGALGGRTFEVLMTRLPIRELQAALDDAARLHPDSPTCADFRAPAWLADVEAEALAAAERWITPHSAIATLAGERAQRVPWVRLETARVTAGDRVVFPASTLGRKGAYELREAARALDFRLVCLGRVIEQPNFWAGTKVEAPGGNWLDGAAAVVLPAFVENRPRRLLAALSAGVPVIATPACGLSGLAGVIEVPAGDAETLTTALANVLEKRALLFATAV